MSKAWIQSKKPEFIRDVLRDFCMVHRELDRHFQFYDQKGHVEFEFMRALLGEEMNKGQLWRLKDTAHLLFRSTEDVPLVGNFLDWSIGYIFHECIKLKEDAYQRQIYGPRFEEFKRERILRDEEKLLGQELFQVILQTKESIDREITRIRFILYHCRRMLILYLADHSDNHLLARFIFDQNEMVQSVFKSDYNELIDALYGENHENLFVYASKSLRQGGWMQDAAAALEQALQIAPSKHSVLQEKKFIDKWRNKLNSRS
ncbi:MAG: hypothetical protein ACOC24_05035 [Desulfovibrionales bacterium]